MSAIGLCDVRAMDHDADLQGAQRQRDGSPDSKVHSTVPNPSDGPVMHTLSPARRQSTGSVGALNLTGMSPEVQRKVRERHAKERFHEPLFGPSGDAPDPAESLGDGPGSAPAQDRQGLSETSDKQAEQSTRCPSTGGNPSQGSHPKSRSRAPRSDRVTGADGPHADEHGGADSPDAPQDSGFGSDVSVVKSLRFDDTPVTPPRRSPSTLGRQAASGRARELPGDSVGHKNRL